MTFQAFLCPDAIPSERALCQHLLWSEQVALMWPDGPEPRGLSGEQQRMAGLLHDLRYPDGSDAPLVHIEYPGQSIVELVAKVAPSITQASSANQQYDSFAAKMTAPTVFDSRQRLIADDDIEQYLYASKFPPQTLQPFIRAGLLTAHEGPNGEEVLRASPNDPTVATRLLVELSAAMSSRMGDSSALVLTNGSVVDAAMRPTSPKGRKADNARVGIGLYLPQLPALPANVTVNQVRELIADDKFRRNRRDYLEYLTQLRSTLTGTTGLATTEDVNEWLLTYIPTIAEAQQQLRGISGQLAVYVRKLVENTTGESIGGLLLDCSALPASHAIMDAVSAVVSNAESVVGLFTAITKARMHPFLRQLHTLA